MAKPKRRPNAYEIRMWRQRRGVTQVQFAEMAGVTERTVQRWEANHTKATKQLKAVMDSYDQEKSGWYHRHPWDALYLPDIPGEDVL